MPQGWRNKLMNDEGFAFGDVGSIPTVPSPQTYTGAIPMPPEDYAQRQFEMPNDYYLLQQQMGIDPNNPQHQQLNNLLRLYYLQQRGRT